MNKIELFILVFSFLIVWSCTEERLVIVDKELEFDENSAEYQTYQAERAMEYIRMFRFEKLGDVFDKLNDPAVKKNLQDSLRKYRSIAENNALYVVSPENDTLFFIPPANDNPTLGDEVWLGTNFLAPYTKMPNSRGVLHGFKNYPATTLFHFYNNLATGVKGLEHLPELKLFRWVVNPADVANAFPDEDYEYVPLQVDLSGNHKLEEIALSGIELGNIIYPDHQLELFSNGGIFSTVGGNKIPSGSLDGLRSKIISVGGDADLDFKISNVKADSVYFSPTIKNLDTRQTEIKSLRVNQVEKVLLNDGLEKLHMGSFRLSEDATLDLSNLTNLTYICLHANQSVDQPIALILPENLSEAAAQAHNHSVNGLVPTFYLPAGSTIINKPSWFDQYATYY